MSGPRIDLAPLMTNIQPSELADSTCIGKGPHGMRTSTYYAGLALRAQIQKLAAGRWRESFEFLEIELPLFLTIKWTRARDEEQLGRWMERLCERFGTLPPDPFDGRPCMREPILLDYEIGGGKVWYKVDRSYLMLPRTDYMYLDLAPFRDAVGKPKAFVRLMRE